MITKKENIDKMQKFGEMLQELATKRVVAVNDDDQKLFIEICSKFDVHPCGGAYTLDEENNMTGRYMYID